MDIMNLGIDSAIIGGIIGLTRVFTGLDVNNRYTRYYPLLPAVFGLLGAFFKTSPFTWQQLGTNFFIYVGISTYAYKVGKTTILDK